MEELIKALQIMMKHGNNPRPTLCEHDTLYVFPNSMDFTPDEFDRLEDYGFYVNDDEDGFYSYRYGSC